MHALRFLFLHGRGYARYDEPGLEVKADLGDCVLSRKAEYSLDGKKTTDVYTLDGVTRKKNHRDAPEPVKKATGIFNLDIEDVKKKICLNFIGQRDPILPEAMSPSQISKLFGSVSGRNKIDSAIKETNVVIKRLVTEKNSIEKDVEGLDEEISGVEASLPPFSPDMSGLVEAMRAQFTAKEMAASLLAANEALEEQTQRLGRIDTTLDKVEMGPIDAEIERFGSIVKIAPKVKPVDDMDFSEIDQLVEESRLIDVDMHILGQSVSIVKDIVELDVEISSLEDDLRHLESDIISTTDRIESLLDVNSCPYSGEKIPKGCRKVLVG
jgi:vacuolar-type H+-ATPase subunit D/Vma8